MTPAAVASFEPVARKEYLDRLAALPETASLTRELWMNVHDEVQVQFDILETEIRRRVGVIRVNAGRTQGDRFFLFSYRTFSLPNSALDPVVVGITFTPADGSVLVEADVSGEQSGDRISAVHSKTVANSTEEVLAAAIESGLRLFQSAAAIAAALKDPSRSVE